MIVPGVPPIGVQQEVFKPERQTKTTATAGVPDEALSELPVEEQQQEHKQQEKHGQQDSLPSGELADDAESSPADAAEHDAEKGGADLPRKGLLVDIRA